MNSTVYHKIKCYIFGTINLKTALKQTLATEQQSIGEINSADPANRLRKVELDVCKKWWPNSMHFFNRKIYQKIYVGFLRHTFSQQQTKQYSIHILHDFALSPAQS